MPVLVSRPTSTGSPAWQAQPLASKALRCTVLTCTPTSSSQKYRVTAGYRRELTATFFVNFGAFFDCFLCDIAYRLTTSALVSCSPLHF